MRFFRDPSWQQLFHLYHASKVILGIAIPGGQNRERREEQTGKVMASPNGLHLTILTHILLAWIQLHEYIKLWVSPGNEEENDSRWAAAVSAILAWHAGFRNYDLRVRDPRKNQGFGIDGLIRKKRQKTRQICHVLRNHRVLMFYFFPRWRWSQVGEVRCCSKHGTAKRKAGKQPLTICCLVIRKGQGWLS